MSGTKRIVKDEEERIDDLLASAIDMDQTILIQAELLDDSLGLVANVDPQCDRIRNDAKRSADLLNSVHERLKRVVAAYDKGASDDRESIPETPPD